MGVTYAIRYFLWNVKDFNDFKDMKDIYELIIREKWFYREYYQIWSTEPEFCKKKTLSV